jgi:hypothetical protein
MDAAAIVGIPMAGFWVTEAFRRVRNSHPVIFLIMGDCPWGYTGCTRTQMDIKTLIGNCQDPDCCFGARTPQDSASGTLLRLIYISLVISSPTDSSKK